MAEYPQNINIKEYKSASGAAKRVHKYLQAYAESVGHSKDNVILKKREDYKRNCWAVIWEGPYNWAISLAQGESIAGAEFPEYRGSAEINGLTNHPHINIECGNGYTLEFYD